MSLIIMACTTEAEYISIYGRRGTRGRQRCSKYTDEQKQENIRKAALKHYYNNYEYCTLQRLSKHIARQVNKESEANTNN